MIKIKELLILVVLAAGLAITAPNVRAAEQDYTNMFCASVGGDTSYLLPDRTRPDCIDDEYVYEVDWANHKAYEGFGQAYHYANVSGLEPGLVLILKDGNGMRYVERMNDIQVCPKLQIWTIDLEGRITKIPKE